MTTDLTTEPIVGEIDDPRQRAYLVAYVVTCGQQEKAAKAAGVSGLTAQRWKYGHDARPPDPTYLAARAAGPGRAKPAQHQLGRPAARQHRQAR